MTELCKTCGHWVCVDYPRNPHYRYCHCAKPATQDHIGIEEGGAWICACGNTEHGRGFHPWNRKLSKYDPNEEKYFRCDKCSRVVDSDTGKFIGFETINARIS